LNNFARICRLLFDLWESLKLSIICRFKEDQAEVRAALADRLPPVLLGAELKANKAFPGERARHKPLNRHSYLWMPNRHLLVQRWFCSFSGTRGSNRARTKFRRGECRKVDQISLCSFFFAAGLERGGPWFLCARIEFLKFQFADDRRQSAAGD
jgi:hypothetical protein